MDYTHLNWRSCTLFVFSSGSSKNNCGAYSRELICFMAEDWYCLKLQAHMRPLVFTLMKFCKHGKGSQIDEKSIQGRSEKTKWEHSVIQVEKETAQLSLLYVLCFCSTSRTWRMTRSEKKRWKVMGTAWEVIVNYFRKASVSIEKVQWSVVWTQVSCRTWKGPPLDRLLWKAQRIRRGCSVKGRPGRRRDLKLQWKYRRNEFI